MPIVAPEKVVRINFGVSVVYVGILLLILLIEFASFPGYGTHRHWCRSIFYPLQVLSSSLWFLINFVSTLITIYALFVIFRIMTQAS